MINKCRGKNTAIPVNVENPIWSQFSWWIENDKFKLANNGNDPKSIEEYVEWVQNRQTKGLSIAVESAKNRFPMCGGFNLDGTLLLPLPGKYLNYRFRWFL